MNDKDDRLYLIHIKECIERIERYSVRGEKAFYNDELVQTFIIHNVQIIGEAISKISDRFREQHPEVPWRQINAMRNIIVHNYNGVDIDVVWKVTREDLSVLKKQVVNMLT